MKKNFNQNSPCIDFQCPRDPIDYLSTTDTTTIYDVAVLAHCIWYFANPSILLATLRTVATRAKRVYLAEWALSASNPAGFAHVLAVLAMASLECRKTESHANVRTVISPQRLKDLAQEAGLTLDSEFTITPPHGKQGMRDAEWEIGHALTDNYAKKVETFVENERERSVVSALLDATRAHAPRNLEGVPTMDVWSGLFNGKT